jgi:hypothetical protein
VLYPIPPIFRYHLPLIDKYHTVIQKLVEDASKLAATVETNNLKPIVHIAAVTREEDDTVHLVAVTGGRARFYISTRYPTGSPGQSLLKIKVRICTRISIK